MPISIYPPTLLSTQSAFTIDNRESYDVFFTTSITPMSEVGHVQIRVVQLTDNKSIVNVDKYPDEIIYTTIFNKVEGNSDLYYVTIQNSDLAKFWRSGLLYKILLRFGATDVLWNIAGKSFAQWKQEQINNEAFSEWSTTMIVKAIREPVLTIANARRLREGTTAKETVESSLIPTFKASTKIQEDEPVLYYTFDLYDDNDLLYATSGRQDHKEKIDSFRFKKQLQLDSYYKLYYSIETKNGYTKTSSVYRFKARNSYLDGMAEAILRVEDDDIYCKENGCIRLYFTCPTQITGNLVILRSSEDNDYLWWEELLYIPKLAATFDDELIYTDFTVESGVKYKYAITLQNSKGLRTNPTVAGNIHHVDFEYAYLYRDDVQLRLLFNQTMASFKHTVLRGKLDTLGGVYPYLSANGNAYYAEFPVNGMISFLMDEYLTFFKWKRGEGYTYHDELVVPADKFNRTFYEEDTPETINTNLEVDNVFVERKFREKVEEFLNDFTPKLYKSPTEGNITIGLMNISLTPEQRLGRMIFSFSATAYEIADHDIDTLNSLKIILVGQYTSLESKLLVPTFGLVRGYFTDDICKAIKKQENVAIGTGYKYSVAKITSLWIEQYPVINLTGEITKQEAVIADLKNRGEDCEAEELELAATRALLSALSGPQGAAARFTLNELNSIMVAPGKIYHVEQPVTSLVPIVGVALVVNYTADLVLEEDEQAMVTSDIETSDVWGLIAGVFSDTDTVLRSYNYNYRNSETYRIYGLIYRNSVLHGEDTTFNVYKTTNIYNIIKQEALKQVENIYNTKFVDKNGLLTDGLIYYSFSALTGFDIEADEGTIVYIGRREDGSDKTGIRIGSTGRYVLDPVLAGDVKYIALSEPLFCVINYRCLTNLETKTSLGGRSYV